MCVCVCVRACVRARVCVCERARALWSNSYHQWEDVSVSLLDIPAGKYPTVCVRARACLCV